MNNIRASSRISFSWFVCRARAMVCIVSRFATGDTLGAAVARRPLESVDYAYTPCSLALFRGRRICLSGSVAQVGGIMAVYGLPLRRLTASQLLTCGRPVTERTGDGRRRCPPFR